MCGLCNSSFSIILKESIAKDFLEKIVKWAKSIKVSDPFEEGCRLGPVISQAQVLLFFIGHKLFVN